MADFMTAEAIREAIENHEFLIVCNGSDILCARCAEDQLESILGDSGDNPQEHVSSDRSWGALAVLTSRLDDECCADCGAEPDLASE